MNLWQIDTGPVVAYLNASDPDHAEVCAVMDDFSGRSVTTPAVITEAMYFVGATPGGGRALATLVDRSGMTVCDVCQRPLCATPHSSWSATRMRRWTSRMRRCFCSPTCSRSST